MEQLSLWEEPAPIVWHQHLDVRYADGTREITCCDDWRPHVYRLDCIYSGYAEAVRAEDCEICYPKKK